MAPLLNAYKAAFELAPACVLLKPDPPFFSIVDVNEKYLTLCQAKKEDFLGKGLFELFAYSDEKMTGIQTVADVLQRVITTRKSAEQKAVRLDLLIGGGHRYRNKYWTAMNTPVLDEQGEVIFILHSPADVTQTFEVPELAKSLERASNLEKEFYKSVFWQAPVAIGVWEGPNFVTLEINPALARLYQKEIEQVVGKNIFEVFPESKERWWPILTEVITSGRPYKGAEVEANLSSEGKNQIAYVNVVMVPHYDSSGKISGLIGVSIDVTEEVMLRKELESSEKMMKLATESAKLGVWDIDLEKRTIHSSSYQWIPGFPLEKAFYQVDEFIDLIVEEDRNLASDVLTKPDRNFNVQVRLYWSDNSIHWVQLTGDVLRDEKNEPVRVVGTTLDITDAKALEKRKDELISTVSHELKTPVTSINAIAQFLERKFHQSNDRMILDLLNKLVNQVKRLTNLIHDLLDASLVEGGHLQLKNTEFMFNQLLEEVAIETERMHASHKVILQSNPPISCSTDKERLRQVLMNLLSNAVKYSPDQKEVFVNAELIENRIKCCVKDLGVGIPDDKKHYIFERFYRVIDEKYLGFQGIGIGLYISKKIIERMNGEIWFNSKEGEGATFCFSIPSLVGNESPSSD